MRLTLQRRLAADVLGCGMYRVWLDDAHLPQIKEAITKADIRALIIRGLIQEKPVQGVSRGRARLRQAQRRKGRRRGHGSRKGKRGARLSQKQAWMYRIRAQRAALAQLRAQGILAPATARMLAKKCHGGFFRSTRHLKLYVEEHELGQR